VRAQPAAVQAAPFPGDADQQGAGAENGQEQVEQDIDHGGTGPGPAGQHVVNADMPFLGQEIGVAFGQVVTEEIEDRGQRK